MLLAHGYTPTSLQVLVAKKYREVTLVHISPASVAFYAMFLIHFLQQEAGEAAAQIFLAQPFFSPTLQVV